MLVIAIAAILAGAVCGDHISPISDTTILASAGAQCNHIDHVSTQLPYALSVAACCIIGFLVAGFLENGYAGLFAGGAVLTIMLTFYYFKFDKPQLKKLINNFFQTHLLLSGYFFSLFFYIKA